MRVMESYFFVDTRSTVFNFATRLATTVDFLLPLLVRYRMKVNMLSMIFVTLTVLSVKVLVR